MISNKVMKVHEFPDCIFYRVGCDCGDQDCDLTVELEYDKEAKMIFLNMYKNLLWSAHWHNRNFFTITWCKIKGALKMLFTDYIQVEESHVLRSKEHIETFIEALTEGLEKLEKGQGE